MNIIITAAGRRHLLAHPEVTDDLLQEAWAKVETEGLRFVRVQVNLNRVIGRSGCMETDNNSDTFWAYRPGRAIPSRFVVGQGREVTTLVVIACRPDGEDWQLVTAYIGEFAPMELHDPYWGGSWATVKERIEAKEFWGSHALTLSTEEADVLKDSKAAMRPPPNPFARWG